MDDPTTMRASDGSDIIVDAAVARDAKAVEIYGSMAGLNGERRNG